LEPLKANEDDTNTAYERAVEVARGNAAEQVLRGGLDDERRHRNWRGRDTEWPKGRSSRSCRAST
jgi:hypothetical protein